MHTHKHEKRIWLPDAHTVQAILNSTESLRSSDDEFERAFSILKKYPQRVTIFGSARTKPHEAYYHRAVELSKALAQEGYAVVSGGGGGIMEAACKGAKEAGGHAVGFNIILPHEQKLNEFTTDHLAFHYFFTRKVMMTFYAHAYVYFPGGFGTFDEFFEVVTLIQTGKMPRTPIILFGSEFWDPLDRFISKHLLDEKLISPGDQDLYFITDSIEEVCSRINQDFNS